jgi:hypothetical protein
MKIYDQEVIHLGFETYSKILRIKTLQTLFTANCGVSQQNSWMIGCMGTVSSWSCESNEKIDNAMSFTEMQRSSSYSQKALHALSQYLVPSNHV